MAFSSATVRHVASFAVKGGWMGRTWGQNDWAGCVAALVGMLVAKHVECRISKFP